MRRVVTLAAAVFVAGSVLSAQAPRGQAADEAAVRQLPSKYESAWNSKNAQQIASLYAPDAVEVQPDGKVLKGRSAIEANLKEDFQRMGNMTLSLETDTVRFLGPNTAVFTGKSTITGGQSAAGDHGHYMVIARKIAGQWKASEVHLAAVPATAEPQATGTSGRSPAAAEAELKEIEDMFVKASLTGDPTVFERLYADNYTFVDPTGQLVTREQDINDLKSGKLKFESHDQSNVQTRVYGDTAVVTGVSAIKGTYAGDDISGRYRWTDTFVRQNGQWKIVASQVNRIMDEGEVKK